MKNKFAVAEKMIGGANNILLSVHEKPDGDALGSMLALKMILERFNKKTLMFCASPISSEFSFLPQIEQIKNKFVLDKIDLVIGLDYGNFSRLGLGESETLRRLNFLTFDHHPGVESPGFAIIEPACSSTAEIVYLFLKSFGVVLSSPIATCLLAGIFGDTGGFRHSNTTAQTLLIASDLLAAGASLRRITSSIFNDNLEIKMEAWRQVFDYLKIDKQSGLIYSFISHKNLSASCSQLGVSVIIDLLNSVPEAKAALILIEREPGCLDGSLRSRCEQKVNVAEIAQFFGGGGHYLAAGFKTGIEAEKVIGRVRSFLLTDNCL